MERIYDVVVLTDSRYTNPKEIDEYTQNVLIEDDLVKKSLEKTGLKVTRLAWDDPDFDWNTTKSVLFRSTWDYFDRFDEFSVWLKKVSKLTKLINSEKIIKWNTDKHYLKDLEEKGTHTIPTVYIEKGSKTTLKKLHKDQRWEDTILKPCVSGSARHTYKLHPENIAKYEKIFQQLISGEAMMLQPFLKSIPEKGEISLMIIGGRFTHAVLKKAKTGDFRVQEDWGGTVHTYKPTSEEIRFAEKAVSNCIEKPLYARVDIATDNTGSPVLVELELIEPELWFRRNPEAVKILADRIRDILLVY